MKNQHSGHEHRGSLEHAHIQFNKNRYRRAFYDSVQFEYLSDLEYFYQSRYLQDTKQLVSAGQIAAYQVKRYARHQVNQEESFDVAQSNLPSRSDETG